MQENCNCLIIGMVEKCTSYASQLKTEYLSENQYFNICNLCVYIFFSIFATYFCVSHREMQESVKS